MLNVTNFEYESSIVIPVSEEDFLEAKSNPNKVGSGTIFLNPDGRRIHYNRRCERKVIVDSKNLIGFFENKLFPIKRTKATETLAKLFPVTSIEKVVHRIVVSEETLFTNLKLRVCYNHEACSLGVKYNVAYEIEYEENSSHDEIVEYEKQLMAKILEGKHYDDIKLEPLSVNDMFACVGTKVQLWNCFNPKQPFVFAYKWNGVKAKLVITKDKSFSGGFRTRLWKDCHDVILCDTTTSGDISFLQDLCMSVEVMDDKIVIFEFIGLLFEKTLYRAEPKTNAEAVTNLVLPDDLMINGLKVQSQKFYPGVKKFPPFDRDQHDGHIVVQNNDIMKMKLAMLDAKCIAPNMFEAGLSTIYHVDFPEAEVGEIYELDKDPGVHRNRYDRFFKGTEEDRIRYEISNADYNMQLMLKTMAEDDDQKVMLEEKIAQ